MFKQVAGNLSFLPLPFIIPHYFPPFLSPSLRQLCAELVPRRETDIIQMGFCLKSLPLQWQDHLISYSMCLSKGLSQSQIHLVEFFHAHSVVHRRQFIKHLNVFPCLKINEFSLETWHSGFSVSSAGEWPQVCAQVLILWDGTCLLQASPARVSTLWWDAMEWGSWRNTEGKGGMVRRTDLECQG